VLSDQAIAERLEAALAETTDVYVSAGVEPEAYFERLRNDILKHQCVPYAVSAQVMAPGFPGLNIGETLRGFCLAKNRGYWLVYSPERDTFFCFWGSSEQNLGAHGVSGSPLHCWSS
jgi:hypothetical protein